MRKAQIWSMDLAASLVIFTSALILMIFAVSYAMQQNQQQLALNIMENAAAGAADSLVRQPGVPADWNASAVLTLGLASKENVLNESKVREFVSLENDTAETLLGIGNYRFYFDVRYSNGTLASLPGGGPAAKGEYPSNASAVVPAVRHVIYMDKVARMRLIVWV